MINWFLKLYLPKYKIKIKVIRRTLQDNDGELFILDYYYRPRNFEIHIDRNLDSLQHDLTLLHELWHIYQYVKRQVVIKRDKTFYKGRDVSTISYKMRAYEVEALNMEKHLYQKYITDKEKEFLFI